MQHGVIGFAGESHGIAPFTLREPRPGCGGLISVVETFQRGKTFIQPPPQSSLPGEMPYSVLGPLPTKAGFEAGH